MDYPYECEGIQFLIDIYDNGKATVYFKQKVSMSNEIKRKMKQESFHFVSRHTNENAYRNSLNIGLHIIRQGIKDGKIMRLKRQ